MSSQKEERRKVSAKNEQRNRPAHKAQGGLSKVPNYSFLIASRAESLVALIAG